MSHQLPTTEDSGPERAQADLATAANVWREFLVDLPLSLGCLPNLLASDALKFASRRLHAQAEHLENLSGCRTLTALTRLQTAFATKAMTDYQQEAVTLIGDAKTAMTVERSAT